MADRRAPNHQLAARCPHCGVRLLASSGLTTDKPPFDGAVAICGECGGVGVFVVGPLGVTIRVPPAAEEEAIRADPRVRRALGALAESYDSWTAADLAYEGDADG